MDLVDPISLHKDLHLAKHADTNITWHAPQLRSLLVRHRLLMVPGQGLLHSVLRPSTRICCLNQIPGGFPPGFSSFIQSIFPVCRGLGNTVDNRRAWTLYVKDLSYVHILEYTRLTIKLHTRCGEFRYAEKCTYVIKQIFGAIRSKKVAFRLSFSRIFTPVRVYSRKSISE
jgi:hypothetical protein